MRNNISRLANLCEACCSSSEHCEETRASRNAEYEDTTAISTTRARLQTVFQLPNFGADRQSPVDVPRFNV